MTTIARHLERSLNRAIDDMLASSEFAENPYALKKLFTGQHLHLSELARSYASVDGVNGWEFKDRSCLRFRRGRYEHIRPIHYRALKKQSDALRLPGEIYIPLPPHTRPNCFSDLGAKNRFEVQRYESTGDNGTLSPCYRVFDHFHCVFKGRVYIRRGAAQNFCDRLNESED